MPHVHRLVMHTGHPIKIIVVMRVLLRPVGQPQQVQRRHRHTHLVIRHRHHRDVAVVQSNAPPVALVAQLCPIIVHQRLIRHYLHRPTAMSTAQSVGHVQVDIRILMVEILVVDLVIKHVPRRVHSRHVRQMRHVRMEQHQHREKNTMAVRVTPRLRHVLCHLRVIRGIRKMLMVRRVNL